MSSRRKSTRGRYNTALQQWHDFCAREQTNYLLPDVTSVLKFFTELYEKGCQYSSITLARSALASLVTLRGYTALSEHPLIKRFIKGVYHLRPPKPKYSSIWDADILLRYWEQIEDNSKLNLLELFKKVTTLLVLLHGLRISTIVIIDINLITMSNDLCIFYPSELLKYDRQGRPRDKIIYKKIENSKLCPMAVTKEYLKRRAEYSVAHAKFLFANVNPYGPPHKDAIARWVKNTLAQAGVNTKCFSSYSCRYSASSKADKMGVDLDTVLKIGSWSRQSTFRKFYSKELEYMDKDNRLTETIVNSFEN